MITLKVNSYLKMEASRRMNKEQFRQQGIEIRKDFPLFNSADVVYLDNAATSQKPECVIQAERDFYEKSNANPLRGLYALAEKATKEYEDARKTVADFIGAADSSEIIFTRNATEGLNLAAYCLSQIMLKEDDEIVVSIMEHHSNIVPWQLLAARKGIAIKVIPMNDKGELLIDAYEKLFSERTKLVSLVHVSNVLGTVNPVKEMIATAHSHGVPVLIDGAQSVPHMKVDVQDLDADFFAFSGHKIYGPTGVGVLYGKEEWLDKLPPYQGGGEMIQNVSFEKTTFNELPFKFEAGTPDYIGTTALAKALDYVSAIGMDKIAAYENELTAYAMKRLKSIEGMRIFGEAEHKSGVISFLVGNIHHLDMGTLLDRLGIAVRTGHHCAQPLMIRLGIEGTVRASFGLYNTKEEVEALAAGIERVSKMF
mgnify:CR=1 FL=1